jgi:hypothetical protein
MHLINLSLADEGFLFENEISCVPNTPDSWYTNIIKFFLMHGTAPQHLDPRKRRALRLKSSPFQLINILFRKKKLMESYYCLEREDSEKVLT